MSTDIYQQSIKQLANEQSGHGSLANADASVTLDNPFCGDRVTMEVTLVENRIDQLAHNVRGCLLCNASASVIGSAATGCDLDSLLKVHDQLHKMLDCGEVTNWKPQWQSLAFFHPVSFHKSRHGCVLLAFNALADAIKKATTIHSSP
jgi:nitrogen fixation protein NifU and related proteins